MNSLLTSKKPSRKRVLEESRLQIQETEYAILRQAIYQKKVTIPHYHTAIAFLEGGLEDLHRSDADAEDSTIEEIRELLFKQD